MTKGIVWAFALLLLAIPARSQSLVPSYTTEPSAVGSDVNSASVMIWGDYGVESTAVQQAFLNKFVFGGYIDEPLKDRVNSRLGDHNRIFYESEAGVAYFSSAGDSATAAKLRWYAQVRQQQFSGLTFPKQLFQLVFYGNGSEKTEQGAFSGAHGYSLTGNRLDVGIQQNNENWGFIAGVGFMQINNAWELDWPAGLLSTTDDAFEVAFDNQLEFSVSDTSQSGFFASEGWALAMDAGFHFNAGGISWHLRAEDVGYARVHDKAITVSLDTAFTYRGRDMAQLVGGEAGLFPSTNTDSLLNMMGATVRTGAFTKVLPAKFSLIAQKELGSWTAMAGINYRLHSYRMPFFFGTVGYQRNSLMYGATLGYGGAGGLKAGLRAQKTFSSRIDVQLGFNHVNAMVAPAAFSGFSAFALLRYRLP